MTSEIKVISGRGIPLIGNDIDTDRIIPARFLRCVTFDGLGENVFADDRKALAGQHSFDQPQYKGAKILVVNRNFGCGSSREHAPQALAKWGIQALVGESFAEIFFGNCVAMGVPCVTGEPDNIKQLQEIITANPQIHITVNLSTMQVECDNVSSGRDSSLRKAIAINPGAKNMFVSGTWDACGQLVANANKVKETAEKLPYISWNQLAAS